MKNTVVDDNEFLLLPFTKRIGLHDFPTKYARGRAEDISKRIFQLLSTPWILPSKYQKIYKDVLLDGGLCHTEGSIERFAQRFSNFTEEVQEESGMHDSSFAFD